MSTDRLAEIKAEQVARIFADLGRNRIQQAMSESQESKGSPEWHRFGQGRWAFTHAANIVNRHLGYPVDIWGEWIEEWSPHNLSGEPVLDPAERERRDLLAEFARLTAERDALAAQVARIEALAEDWRYKGQFGWGAWQIGEGPDPEGYVMDHCASALRAALAGFEADTTDTQSTDQDVK